MTPDELLFSGPFRRDLTGWEDVPTVAGETEFEAPRGVSRVDVRRGSVRAHVSRLPEPADESRMRVLEAVARAGVSIDFLKFTPSGLSFLANEDALGVLEATLTTVSETFSVRADRCVVLVHAVNMRDEEGLMALVLAAAIGVGAEIEHIGDMHDGLLLVVPDEFGDALAERLRADLIEQEVGA